MNSDDALAVLRKLVKGNKDECFRLIETVRKAYPGQSMQWCIQKVIYDVRFGKKTIQPNTTLSRWGEGGGGFSSSPSSPPSPAKPQATAPQKAVFPPPPPANPVLSTPKVKTDELKVSLPDLAALAKAKRQMVASVPASHATKEKLYKLVGNKGVGDRLVQRLRAANPDRSEQWAFEKAIYDLERDRV